MVYLVRINHLLLAPIPIERTEIAQIYLILLITLSDLPHTSDDESYNKMPPFASAIS